MKRASSGFASMLAALVSIAAVHVAVQARVHAVRELPSRDGGRFLHYALRLAEEPQAIVVLRTSDDHPGYPVVLAAVLHAGRALGQTSPEAMLRVATLLGSLTGLAFTLCGFLAMRRLWGGLVAWIAALSLVTLPRPALVFGDVLSDPLHALLWTASVYACLRALPRARTGWLVLGGLLAGAAYWVRVDALTLPAAMLAAACALALRGQMAPGAALRAAATYGGVFALNLGLFWWACGRLSTKPVFLKALGLAPAAPGGPLLASIGADPASAPVRAIAHYFNDLGQGVQFVHLAAAGLGILLGVWRRRWRTSTLVPQAVVVAAAFTVFSAFILAVDWRYGYLSTRYFVPILWLVLGLGAHTVIGLAPRRPRSVAALFLAASLAASAPSLARARRHDQFHGHVRAGELLAGRIRAGETVFDPYFYPTFLAGLRPQSERGALRPDGSPQSYLIVADGDLGRHAEVAEALAAGRIEAIAALPRRAGGADSGVKLYRAVPQQ